MEEYLDRGEIIFSDEETAVILAGFRQAEIWEQQEAFKSAKRGRQFFENRIDSEWLTTEEAASYLSLSPNALRIRVHRDQIKVYKFGRQLRFRREDCRALFQRKGAI
ncbi:MAG: helix-turn-helix domain-containing protein [Bdellovibrionota bacterium]